MRKKTRENVQTLWIQRGALCLALALAVGACQNRMNINGSLTGNSSNSTNSTSGPVGTFSIQTASPTAFNLGTSQTVSGTITADSNYTGTVSLSVSEPELALIDKGQAIGFTVSPSTVSLTPGSSANFSVTVNVGTMAPDFTSSMFHVVGVDTSHPAGQSFLTSVQVNLQVNAVYIVNILKGAESGIPEKWTVPANSTVSFANHPGGLTVSFNDLDTNTQFPPRIHSTAGSGTILHQPGDLNPSLDGTNPNPTGGTYTQTVTTQSEAADTIYDHNNESAGDGGRTFVFNVPVVAPSPTPSSNPNATFGYINTNVIQATCVNCHNPSTKAGGYDFTTYSGVDSAVKAGSSITSPLYLSVQSGSMPQGGSPLSSALIQDINDWINSGAPNN